MKAVIVEDEPLAVDNLKHYLKEYPLEIAGSACSLREAARLIKKEKPDVVFLDINLSGENGFDLFDRVAADFKVIFVTAYDEFAVRAFEVNALDYILKPLKKERIAAAMQKLLTGARHEECRQKYKEDDSLFLATGTKACFLKVGDIRFIQADSSYSKIFLAGGACKSSTRTLRRWEKLLPADRFVRIHRSYLVNIAHIGGITKKRNGTYSISLQDMKVSVGISRRYASTLRNKFNL
jgi:two-component system LytT family response regulator